MFSKISIASRTRIADSIRAERASVKHHTICRLVTNVSQSLWDYARITGNIIGSSGRVKRELTQVPDYPALFSLMWQICRHSVRLSRRERAFLVHIALEAQQKGIWLCESSPLTVVFHCAPSLHCVSVNYPDEFVDYLLMRIDSY